MLHFVLRDFHLARWLPLFASSSWSILRIDNFTEDLESSVWFEYLVFAKQCRWPEVDSLDLVIVTRCRPNVQLVFLFYNLNEVFMFLVYERFEYS